MSLGVGGSDDGCTQKITFVDIGLLRVELLCGLLVRVCLDAQGFLDGEDFEQEGEVPVGCAKSLDDALPDELWVACEVLGEDLVRLRHPRGRLWVCAHP